MKIFSGSITVLKKIIYVLLLCLCPCIYQQIYQDLYNRRLAKEEQY